MGGEAAKGFEGGGRERVGGAIPGQPSAFEAPEIEGAELPEVDAEAGLFAGARPAQEGRGGGRVDEMFGRLPSPPGRGRPGRRSGILRLPEGDGSGTEPAAGGAGTDAPAGDLSGTGVGVGSRSGGRRPAYPETARREGWEGVVTLEMLVEADGSVSEVVVVRSSGHDCLDESALAAARTWTYEPARLNGKPVAAKVRVPVRFDLTD
jgi:TonB family protein